MPNLMEVLKEYLLVDVGLGYLIFYLLMIVYCLAKLLSKKQEDYDIITFYEHSLGKTINKEKTAILFQYQYLTNHTKRSWAILRFLRGHHVW